jgi:hypothetical protein
MREKIAGYMDRAGRALPAEQILREVLNIRSPNAFAADKVLRGILAGDPRFREVQGLWHLVSEWLPRTPNLASLHIEWDARRPQSCRGAVCLPERSIPWELADIARAGDSDWKAVRDGRSGAEDHLLLVWSGKELRLWNRLLGRSGIPAWRGERIALQEVAAAACPEAGPCRELGDLAQLLELPAPAEDTPAAKARFLAVAYLHLLERVPTAYRQNPAELADWIAESKPRVDFGRFAFDRDLLAQIPPSPGVYLMRDRAGETIYIGKSANLQRRVRSYFTTRALRDAKVARIHSQLYSLEYLTSSTEVEALLLETRMIRDFRPAINLQEDIHTRSGRRRNLGNLLLLVPTGDKAEVYLIKDGSFVSRQSVPLGAEAPKRLCMRVRTTFFGTRSRKPTREAWEIEIVARWLAARRRRLNFLDVDEAGTYDSVIRRLTSYLRDPDRLANKVYYRG